MSAAAWPEAARTRSFTYDGEVYFVAEVDAGARTFHGRGADTEAAEAAAWGGYLRAHDPGHTHDFDPGRRQDGFGQCRGCGMGDTRAFEQRRTIDHGTYALAHPWPAHWLVQGGSSGLVLRRDHGPYRTAFVEVFPTDPQTFVRGEGATLAEAEQAAWDRVQTILACPGHEYETRGYTNGAGFCRHCHMFATGVFDVAEVGNPCSVCGTRTNWTQVVDAWFCQDHAPTAEQRARLRERARARGQTSTASPLQELLEALREDIDG